MNDPTDSGEPLMNRNETKVDELVRRLKKHPVWTMDKQNVTADAAEVITALQARVHELEVESRRLGEALDFHTDNIEPQMRETITQKDAEIARLHTQTREQAAEIKSLRNVGCNISMQLELVERQIADLREEIYECENNPDFHGHSFPPSTTTCKHEWVDARNQVVKSGEICQKCYAMRAGNTTTTGEE